MTRRKGLVAGYDATASVATRAAVKALLIEGGHADEEKLKAIDKELRDIVVAAAQYAQDTPEPDESELMSDIYA